MTVSNLSLFNLSLHGIMITPMMTISNLSLSNLSLHGIMIIPRMTISNLSFHGIMITPRMTISNLSRQPNNPSHSVVSSPSGIRNMKQTLPIPVSTLCCSASIEWYSTPYQLWDLHQVPTYSVIDHLSQKVNVNHSTLNKQYLENNC